MKVKLEDKPQKLANEIEKMSKIEVYDMTLHEIENY